MRDGSALAGNRLASALEVGDEGVVYPKVYRDDELQRGCFPAWGGMVVFGLRTYQSFGVYPLPSAISAEGTPMYEISQTRSATMSYPSNSSSIQMTSPEVYRA